MSDSSDTLRRRLIDATGEHKEVPTATNAGEEEMEQEAGEPGAPDLQAVSKMNQGTGYVPEWIKRVVKNLSPRWGNWVIRLFTTVMLISCFSFLVYLGPLALVFLVLLIQLGCFHEIINIGYVIYRSKDLPCFRSLSWYFLFTSNYFLFGESLIARFRILLAKEDFLQPLITHHQFIAFCLYCGGLMGFVLSLVKKHYLQQFMLFGWTHVTLLLIVTTSHCIIQNIFNGIIWFLVPVSMVICNDIMAYVFGFFLGKTPLIKLSPKKTWEGFIGGGISTIIFGLVFSLFLIHNDHYVCPIEYDDAAEALITSCVRNPVFSPKTYNVSKLLFFIPFRTFTWYPYLTHCFVIGLYTSIVGPFGGFFASGFKRAFRIKDFGDILPGHGGIMDRFDCQVIVGAFVFLYYKSFIALSSPNELLHRILVLPMQEQLDFYRLLTKALLRRGTPPSQLATLVADLVGTASKHL